MNQLRKMIGGRHFVLGAAAVLALTLGHSACGRVDNSPAVPAPKLACVSTAECLERSGD